MSDSIPRWVAGQRAALNRSCIVTIARVTPTGRAIVEIDGRKMTFNPNGTERKEYDIWQTCNRLEHMTHEIETEVMAKERAEKAFLALRLNLENALRWWRNNHPERGRPTPSLAVVERAEKLARLINQWEQDAMKGTGNE